MHTAPLWKDCLWQVHMELELEHPPKFEIEEEVARDSFYRFLQMTWMLQQVPLGVALYILGGIPFVVWGISARICISHAGHWLIAYFVHNTGSRPWYMVGHAVQGRNLPHLGMITFGECWHNNHHAFPGSAKLGHQPGQSDPGWWLILALEKLGLAWDIRLPDSFSYSPGRVPLSRDAQQDRDRWLLNQAEGEAPVRAPLKTLELRIFNRLGTGMSPLLLIP